MSVSNLYKPEAMTQPFCRGHCVTFFLLGCTIVLQLQALQSECSGKVRQLQRHAHRTFICSTDRQP